MRINLSIANDIDEAAPNLMLLERTRIHRALSRLARRGLIPPDRADGRVPEAASVVEVIEGP